MYLSLRSELSLNSFIDNMPIKETLYFQAITLEASL